jgi:hypothetical protein
MYDDDDGKNLDDVLILVEILSFFYLALCTVYGWILT